MSNNFNNYQSHLFTIFFNGNKPPKEVKLAKLSSSEKTFFDKNFEDAKLENTDLIIHNIKCGLYSLQQSKYLVIKNLENNDTEEVNPELFETVELNPTIFLLSSNDLDLKISTKFTDNDIENNIRYQHQDYSYKGHDWRDLSKHTEKLTTIKIDCNSALYNEDFSTISFTILSYFNSLSHLKFNNNLTDKYRKAFNVGSLYLKDNIFLSYSSTHWKHAFLEVYRCVEAIYSLPWALDIKSSLNLDDTPAQSISLAVIDALGYRGREKSSLVKLLCRWPHLKDSSIFETKLMKNIDTSSNELSAKTAEKIYYVRNQLVHQFDVTDEHKLSPDDYSKLVSFLLDICIFFYTEYEDEFEK